MDYISIFWLLCFLAFIPLFKINKYLAPLLIFIWVYTVIWSQWPVFLRDFKPHVLVAIERDQNQILALCLGFILLMRVEIKTEKIQFLLGYLAGLNYLLTLFFIPFKTQFLSGLVPNKSMNAILNVMLFPFIKHIVIKRDIVAPVLLMCLLPFLVFSANSSSAWLSFFMMTVYGLYCASYKRAAILVALLSPLTLFLPQALYGGFRLSGYKTFLAGFNWIDYLIGYGPGSFWGVSVELQHTKNFNMEHGYFWYGHSDIFQAMFEYGLISFPFILYALYGLFKYGKTEEKAALLAFLGGCAFYYPAHFPVHLFVLFLILKIFSNNYEDTKSLKGFV